MLSHLEQHHKLLARSTLHFDCCNRACDMCKMGKCFFRCAFARSCDLLPNWLQMSECCFITGPVASNHTHKLSIMTSLLFSCGWLRCSVLRWRSFDTPGNWVASHRIKKKRYNTPETHLNHIRQLRRPHVRSVPGGQGNLSSVLLRLTRCVWSYQPYARC